MDASQPQDEAGGTNQANMDNNGHPNLLVNETPMVLAGAYYAVVSFIQLWGWYLLLAAFLLLYLWVKLQPSLRRWAQQREDDSYYKKYDSETIISRQEAFDAARRRMQESHDAKAAKFAEEQKLRDEKKRQEKLEDWERHKEGRGYRSKYKPADATAGSSSTAAQPPKKKTPLRPQAYNPLSGGGSGGACFRPTNRGGSRGG